MEEFTKEDIEYINDPFNFYDKLYLKGLENIEIKNLTEQDIQSFQRKQKENITKLKGEILEKNKHGKKFIL